ncbi:MAG: ABC transporter ATP-binding protein [Holosporales bacterium]|jgi:ABC-2 type transport system ATP-binding protein|nr:ABC transporter ATP-binding protein [Holosporales bacterium]
MISIEVQNIFKQFGEVVALNGCSLSFSAGVIHGIIGPEGAGKTTLLRILLGLLDCKAGEFVYFKNGESMAFKAVRDHIAYMPETQSLYGDLSIEEHMRFFKDMYEVSDKEYEEKSAELLSLTRLHKFKDRPAGKLSGGMYKKLGLICALLRSPQVMLLDEPTNGVDPISRREFWDLLYNLVRKNRITVLMATAYMDEAERCTHVHLMERGRVLAEGEPKSLLTRFAVRNFDELFLRHADTDANVAANTGNGATI